MPSLDRGSHPARNGSRTRHGGDGGALGWQRSQQRSRTLRGGGIGGARGDRERHRSVDPVGALPELVEAAIRLGETELARDALDRLAATTQPAGTDFALGMEARSRALVSGGEAAEPLVSRVDRTAGPDAAPSGTRARTAGLSASGCAVRVAAASRASSFGSPRRCSPRSGWRRSLTAPGRAGRRRREAAHAPPRGCARSSRRRRSRSPGSPATGSPTPTSAPAVPQSRARSSTTCTRCSASWGSTRARLKPPCREGRNRTPPCPTGVPSG